MEVGHKAPQMEVFLDSEKYLKGKSGILIDSFEAAIYFPEYVSDLGGKGEIIEHVPENLLETIKKEGINFLIVHNYVLRDKARLLQARKMGVEILLLRRELIPPEQKRGYTRMYHQLEKLGASITFPVNIDRSRVVKKFLKKVYGQESEK